MDPEATLSFIEGTSTYMDGITHVRNGLIERGWSADSAEKAALALFANMARFSG